MFDLETIIYRNQQRGQERERQAKQANPQSPPPVHRTEAHDYIKGAI